MFIQDDEEDDDEDDDLEEDDDLTNLVNNLPNDLKQRVLREDKADDDDDEEEETTEDLSWGKKKSYWDGDTADLEIGQDIQDAKDEEDAALVINDYILIGIDE